MSIYSMSSRFNQIEKQWASVNDPVRASYTAELDQMLVDLQELPAQEKDAGQWLARRIKRMLRSPGP